MQQGLTIVIPLIIFSILDLVILINALRNRVDTGMKTMFFLFAGCVTLQQICAAFSYAGLEGIIILPRSLVCINLVCGSVMMSASAHFWYECLVSTLSHKTDDVHVFHYARGIPVMIYALVCAASQGTHWIYYVDETATIQVGPLAGLQLVCPILYVIAAIPVVLKEKKESDRIIISRTVRNFIIFVIPAMVGTIIHFTLFRGGYSQIGISVGLVLMYLEQYMEVVNESKRLKSVENLNLILEENQEKLQTRLNIINSMSTVYFASYYINVKEDTYIELSSIDNVRKEVNSIGKAQETLNFAAERLVQPEYTALMKEFWDLSTINDRLREKSVVSIEYIGATTGWSMALLIAGDRDEDGNLNHIFYAARTIHDEKAREMEQTKKLAQARHEAEAANAAKTTFLFNMSHDIRTPMNAILGYLELITRDFDDKEKCREYVGKMKKSSDFLLSLINNVLEMARIESGQYEVDEIVEAVGNVTQEIRTVFEKRMKEKNIAFTYSIDAHTEYIYIDAVKVNEVFLNIVSNAVKYTPAGGKIDISIRELPSCREGYVVFQTKISDTGIGMSKEFLPHIFDEFSREKTVTEDKIEGTGLGMPIVKKFVELLGGTISVESELGEGTTFTITLPHRIADERNLQVAETAEVEYDVFMGKRILLAEDNDINAEIATEILIDAGFEVERAVDGAVCTDMLQQAEAGYYDLILMDIQMPNMDGYEATQLIRQLEDRSRRYIPIVAMTANAFEEDRQHALEIGMNAHLGKPIKIDEMMHTLADILGKKR